MNDKCPLVAETYNLFQDQDGCPDNNTQQFDSDGDGVPDVMDMCPDQNEVWNKYVDHDGCPDILPTENITSDSDNDGITDDIDSCPNEKETWNKIQ